MKDLNHTLCHKINSLLSWKNFHFYLNYHQQMDGNKFKLIFFFVGKIFIFLLDIQIIIIKLSINRQFIAEKSQLIHMNQLY